MMSVILMVSFGVLSSPSVAEFERVKRSAWARAAQPGGGVDLLRLAELGPWCDRETVLSTLRRAGQSRRFSHLNRAIAWWSIRELALEVMDMDMARDAAQELGLITQFVMRSGAAPPADASLDPKAWRPYPENAGSGVIHLDAFLYPNRETRATIATNLILPKARSAVLRIGYDDAVAVWLNGEEVYRSEAEHQSFLDQSAIAVQLQAGPNRLMVEVRQGTGAWRFMGRLTTADGAPLKVEASPQPWSPTKSTVGGVPKAIETIWNPLYKRTADEPPDPVALRDLADYARLAHLPDRDQTMVQIALEGAYEVDGSAKTLRAWVRLLQDARRARLLDRQSDAKITDEADEFAALQLALEQAWDHFYSRRTGMAWASITQTQARHPQSLEAHLLRVSLLEDQGWSQSAVSGLEAHRESFGHVFKFQRAFGSVLRAAGRVTAEGRWLRERMKRGLASADDWYRLSHLDRMAGDFRSAEAREHTLLALRPELWQQTLATLRSVIRVGDLASAERLHTSLLTLAPKFPELAVLSVRLARHRGDETLAREMIEQGIKHAPRHDGLRRLKSQLGTQQKRPSMGPSIQDIDRAPCADHPAQVLYQHARTEVAKDGRADRWIRRVVQICSELGAQRYGYVDVFHVPSNQRLDILKARRYRGDSWSMPIHSERSLSNEESRLYYDLRASRLRFERSQPGDVIDVLWRLTDLETDQAMPGEYGELAYLQEEIPRSVSVLEVAGDGADRVNVGLVTHGLPVTQTPGRYRLEDVPAVPLEFRMPGQTDAFAFAHLSTSNEWATVETLYRKLLGDRLKPTPQLARFARGAVDGLSTIEDKVTVLYQAVVDRIRYIGLEFGIHSFQPTTPADTWARGYGDCKDKAVLLIALLDSVGIDARFVLVRTRGEGRMPQTPASLAVFDHAMVYLPDLDTFIDPTVSHNAPWTLPSPDEGATVLVLGDNGNLRTVTPRSAETHHVRLELSGQVTPKGDASGTVDWTLTGSPARPTRRALEPSGTRPTKTNEAIGRWIPGLVVLQGQSSGLRPPAEPVQVKGRFQLKMTRQGQKISFPVTLGAWPGVDELGIGAVRRQPLVLPHLVRISQNYTLRFPAGKLITPPESVDLSTKFGSFRVSVQVTGRVLKVSTDFRLSASVISVSDYSEFRRWITQVRDVRRKLVEVDYGRQ